MSYRYPLVMWGTPSNVSAYTAVGTATVTSALTDPFGASNAYQINDANNGTAEARYTALGTLPNGTNWFILGIRGNTATKSGVEIWDNTASAVRHRLSWTWSGGATPTSVTTLAGGGTILAPISAGNPWWWLVFSATGIVGANTNRLYLYPADPATASDQGIAIFYVANVVLLDYLDNAVSYDEPREGSQTAQAPSGVEDAWTVGTDQRLRATARWIPAEPREVPALVSGWYGANEFPGTNCGVAAMLRAGRDKQVLRYVPDRSVCSTYMDSYLVEPMRGAPSLDAGGLQRTFEFELRGSTVYTGY